jgi:adenylylsulfate kinase-like enzyme
MKPLTNLDTQNTKATVWISGVTASGKTTLGASLYQSLLNLGIKNLVHLDGDELRAKQSKVYGHSLEERMELIQKYIELVQEENNKGNVVIISTVSHKKEMHVNNLLTLWKLIFYVILKFVVTEIIKISTIELISIVMSAYRA